MDFNEKMVEQYIINFAILCSFSLIFIIITLIVGVRIIWNYFNKKAIVFLLIGLAWIGLSFPWLPEAFKFFFILFNADIGETTALSLYLILNIMSSPIFLIIWIIAINELITIKKIYKNLFMYGTIVLTVVFELLIIIFLLIDRNLIVAEYVTELYSILWSSFIQIFQVILLIIVVSSGIIFARESLATDNKEVNLKGKFLLIAFISFAVGAVLEVFFTVNTLLGLIFKIISRIILMSASIEYLIGFIMPERIKKIFL